MNLNAVRCQIATILLFALLIAGCNRQTSETAIFTLIAVPETIPVLATKPITPTATTKPLSPGFDASGFAFPTSIDPARTYLFYLHGKILEDQGMPAISPEYGEYDYGAILEKLSRNGLVVISEIRPKDTDGVAYAKKVAQQVLNLIKAGVPAENITVVGASKGGAITIYVAHLLKNRDVNFVILAGCHPDTVKEFKSSQVFPHGNTLSIYDSSDSLAGPCKELFTAPENQGVARLNELVLEVGTGHGVLYQPLDEWVIPTIEFANNR